MPAAMQNFHVPLSDEMHRELKTAAKTAGRPATELARELVTEGLERIRRERVAAELREYVAAMAGTPDDFDPLLEAASLEHLQETE